MPQKKKRKPTVRMSGKRFYTKCPACMKRDVEALSREGSKVHCRCAHCKLQFTEINRGDNPDGYRQQPRIKYQYKSEFKPKISSLAEGLINSEPLFIPMPDWDQKDLGNRDDGRYQISFEVKF